MQRKIKALLVTGGFGFIGSHFVNMIKNKVDTVVVVDSQTYAAINAPKQMQIDDRCIIDNVHYFRGCITNELFIKLLFEHFKIDAVVNFAAETHVDNSIVSQNSFINTNIIGVNALLNVVNKLWNNSDENIFIQISTDEVYGSLKPYEYSFTERSPYNPRNPYSASKAGADMLVSSFVNTFKTPAIITHCCNNYGPGQHEEKFIPTIIRKIKNGEKVPVYGNGTNIREWIFVEDHCSAVEALLFNCYNFGEHYNIGSGVELSNLDLVECVCEIMGECGYNTSDVIDYVDDRLGHDFRYSINYDKIISEYKWTPVNGLRKALKHTVKSYL